MDTSLSRRPLLLSGLLLLLAACQVGQGTPASPLRILAYNIRHGAGMDDKLDLERAAQLIRSHDPDIVTLQEIDNSCTRTGGVDQAAWLGEACGLHSAFGAFMPYQGGEYGMAVLSRYPILKVHNLRLPDGSEPRIALGIEVLTPQGPVTVVSIHLYRTEAERLAQAETLMDYYRDWDHPVVLAGDFNSQPGTAVMQRLAEDFTEIPCSGNHFTFPADAPERQIDYCLVRPGSRMHAGSMRVIDEPLISDHRPLLIELSLGADALEQ
ncbi:MAG: endonuclease/exonuclease/phosphatase family metal-dependent hydrolase [Planctomycetota bacterium]|jgi:endonuclease/exonuclease/phosphatase family metal-dependent hydrolase